MCKLRPTSQLRPLATNPGAGKTGGGTPSYSVSAKSLQAFADSIVQDKTIAALILTKSPITIQSGTITATPVGDAFGKLPVGVDGQINVGLQFVVP